MREKGHDNTRLLEGFAPPILAESFPFVTILVVEDQCQRYLSRLKVGFSEVQRLAADAVFSGKMEFFSFASMRRFNSSILGCE
jgi:hypothetical protein